MSAARLLGRGPILRLATLATDTHTHAVRGAPFACTTWNAGRVLDAEEWRCGMLLHSYSTSSAAGASPARSTHADDVLAAEPVRAQCALSASAPSSSSLSPRSLTWRRRSDSDAARACADGRLGAIVKAQSSDFQVTEVDAHGSAACLDAAPRPRWRKVARNATMLIEDTAEVPFSDPSKSFSPRVQTWGTYVRQLGTAHDAHAAVHFVLYRDAYSLPQVLHRFAYEIAVDAEAVRLHEPPGGYYGCVCQRGVCVGGTRDALLHVSRHYNLRPLLLRPCGYCSAADVAAHTQPPRAHVYRVLLRCVHGDDAAILSRVRQLARYGFVNYFGVERFGVGSSALHHIGAYAGQSDLARAVGAVLQTIAESDASQFDSFMAYANAEPGTVAAMAAAWRDKARAARAPRQQQELLCALCDYHAAHAVAELYDRHASHPPGRGHGGDGLHAERGRCGGGAAEEAAAAAAALERVWRATGMLPRCQRSAAEFVWNAVASQRLISYGNRVVVGDVVRKRRGGTATSRCPGHANTNSGEDSTSATTAATRTSSDRDGYSIVQTSAEAATYGMDDVVLPVPYAHTRHDDVLYPHTEHVDRALYDALAQRHSLDKLLGARAAHGDASAPQYRPLVCKATMLQAAVVHDPTSLTTLKTDSFCLQERKVAPSLTLDYTRRVREPCRYNVSERFAERMAYMRESVASGTKTLVLSFVLPHDTSALVALRDVFALRYGTFTDLYGV